MFIKREPTPYKEHEINTPYSISNFRDWRFAYGVSGGKSCRVWFVFKFWKFRISNFLNISFRLQVIGLKGVIFLIVHPVLELGASVCWTYTVYIYFKHRFINHDNVLIPCTNNFDQIWSLYYYKCKWTYHVHKSTASKRTPHASHINHPECSVGRGEVNQCYVTLFSKHYHTCYNTCQ